MCGCRLHVFFLLTAFSVKTCSLLDQKRWSCLASIMVESSSPSSGITAFQRRVKYFSTTHLFFTSGTTDVSLFPWPFYLPCLLSEKRGGGGHVKKGYRARREEEDIFLCVILRVWSLWTSVSMNSLSAPKGKLFLAGICGMKPEGFYFDPCALPSLSPLPPDSRAWGRNW